MKIRLSAGVVCAVLGGLLASPASAAAVTAAPTMVEAASWIAGHPVTVACDADVNPSPFAAPGYVATAWTYTGGDMIHSHPAFCADSFATPGTLQFAAAIDVFLHEAARARGVQTDSCVEMTADVGVFDVLRRFYNIPFFSALSQEVGAQVLALTRTLPASFQPETCWTSGVYR